MSETINENLIEPFLGQFVINRIKNSNLNINEFEKKELSILSIDIMPFTGPIANLENYEIRNSLNYYLKIVADCVLDNSGFIELINGSLLICDFGLLSNDYTDNACESALKILDEVENYNQNAESNLKLSVCVGISTGLMDYGILGSERKKIFASFGKNRNDSQRLLYINKAYKTKIMIDENTKNRIENKYITKEIDRLMQKGYGAFILYELVGYK
jgi:adenylate cyclase